MAPRDLAATSDWHEIARQSAHRPWPPPVRPWVIAQTWTDLLFAHWTAPAQTLRPMIPAELELDTFDGQAWVGVIPFRIPHLAPRGAPFGLRIAFPELNVRTYVTAEGKPGVWFFSLDAASPLAVIMARATFHLPYYWARMALGHDRDRIHYASRRRGDSAAAARFKGWYEPTGLVYQSEPGSLEHWLTARYCLYAAGRAGRLFRGEINHPPWPLQPAAAEIAINTMAAVHGIHLAGPPLLHFSRRMDVVAWRPQCVG